MQASALRCIYGFEVSYAQMRERAAVTTLRQRWIEACDKFARKCIGSSRFSEWFPLKNAGRSGGRRGETYKEEFARCNRLRDSPIFYMRRRMNGKEGKRYGERNKEYRTEDTAGRSSTRPKFKARPDRRLDRMN